MSYVNEAWIAWRALFADLPGGDPYIAVGAIMVLVAILARIASGDPQN